MALSTKVTGKEATRRAKESLLSQTVTTLSASGISNFRKGVEFGRDGTLRGLKLAIASKGL